MYYDKNTTLFLDGRFTPATKAHANIYGQTLHYGYGVFEGIRSYQTDKGTRIFKGKEHYERLKHSAELIGIPFKWNAEELVNQTYELLSVNELSDAYIRPLVFCSPNMTLSRPHEVHLMICAWTWGAYLGERLLRLHLSSFCRPHPRSTYVEAKACGHYVNSILATIEAKDKGYDEALLLDHEGFLAEGPGANLFFGKGKHLFTPATGNILPGITRATIIELAKEAGFNVTEGKFILKDLLNADYAFYCGTAAEVVGIESIKQESFAMNWSQSPGAQLRNLYLQKVREKEFDKSFTKI